MPKNGRGRSGVYTCMCFILIIMHYGLYLLLAAYFIGGTCFLNITFCCVN